MTNEITFDTLDPVKTAKDILKLRTQLKLTQEQFAFGLNMHRRSVQEWENGRKVPSGAILLYFQHLAECRQARAKFYKHAIKFSYT